LRRDIRVPHGGGAADSKPGATEERIADWALAIHGGAGKIPRHLDPKIAATYEASLQRALEIGSAHLRDGGSSLDAVTEVVRTLEDDALFNAGIGAVFTHEGSHELDAAVMDGRSLACGAVAGVSTVRNPVLLARLIMEKTHSVFLAGRGAEAFAHAQGMPPVDPSVFDTARRRRQLEKAQAAHEHGTVGCVALDRDGHLAAATSTGGRTNKRWGRIGDTPIIGAGTYASDASCAVSCTGRGEPFIRHTIARDLAALLEYEALSLPDAAARILARLERGDGGWIAVSRRGEIDLSFNTQGMYRGAADACGRFEVAIHAERRTGRSRRA
jgi:beta-aspartyl-peptidase (threonine type)